MPTITGAHHLALTVTDVQRSAAWYADLLGMVPVFDGAACSPIPGVVG
jgi:catechol 2,3-dioxygenase-like lactoylglutathione lyase family enzyme